ncbi:membrane-associated protein [Raineyella antarctica]|uniref:Membrane-associated protein n=1 Tax=Raineyella antarctica TaxID=1577474 RepID=A0A1G6GDK3_9ACTN|nr:VTT domain-containing protein [Raineyella antarctica]SDB79815.1 membrane-associated protein [Raineyella antarctica]
MDFLALTPLAIPGLHYLGDPAALLHQLGPWALVGIALMVFIESGLLFPFLPGDSLIFTAGLLHFSLGLNLWVLIGVTFVCAFLGDQAGYFLGSRFGRGLFKDDARVLKTEHLTRAEQFFHRYGGRSLVMARFVPVVRTYVPLVAGMVRHPYRHFLGWNALGGLLWVAIMSIAGATLGGFAIIANHVDVIAIVIVLVSLIPVFLQLLATRRDSGARRAVESVESEEV